MKYVKAAGACFVLFTAYGIFSLMMGWRNLGGFIPMMLVLAGLAWVWRSMTSKS